MPGIFNAPRLQWRHNFIAIMHCKRHWRKVLEWLLPLTLQRIQPQCGGYFVNRKLNTLPTTGMSASEIETRLSNGRSNYGQDKLLRSTIRPSSSRTRRSFAQTCNCHLGRATLAGAYTAKRAIRGNSIVVFGRRLDSKHDKMQVEPSPSQCLVVFCDLDEDQPAQLSICIIQYSSLVR